MCCVCRYLVFRINYKKNYKKTLYQFEYFNYTPINVLIFSMDMHRVISLFENVCSKYIIKIKLLIRNVYNLMINKYDKVK